MLSASVAAGVYLLVDSKSTTSRAGATASPTSSPKGQLLLFGSLTYGHVIYSVRPDGTHLKRLTRTGYWDFALSPDGDHVAFTRSEQPPSSGRSALFALNLVTGRARRVTPWAAGGYRHPLWVARGQRIVYGSCGFAGRNGCAIWSIRPDGSGALDLTRGLTTNGYASVSPDGTRVAFSSVLPGIGLPSPGKVYVERIDGSQRHVVAGSTISGVSAWSGALLVFENVRMRMEVVSLSGRVLWTLPVYANSPVPSPDGTRLAFELGRRLYIASNHGKRIRRINPGSRPAENFAWSPDGTHIAYTEFRPHVHTSIVVANLNGHIDSVIPFKKMAWVVAWRR